MTVVAAELPEEQEDRLVLAQLVTYLDGSQLGDAIVRANDWDWAPLEALRSHPLIAVLGGQHSDFALSAEQRVEVAKATIPRECIASTSAIGDYREVAARLHDFLDAGCDEVILHGSTPDMLGDVVDAFIAQ